MPEPQAPQSGQAVKDRWLGVVLGVDLTPRQAAPRPTPGAPPADFTAGLNQPPADFATYPDDVKAMWEKVKAGDEAPINGMKKNGLFNSNDGKIYLNTNPECALKDFESSLDLVAHENGHNYQRQLVAKLRAGLLKAGDAEYEQALMFEANAEAGARIVPEAAGEFADYTKQPKEEHSFLVGGATALEIISGL